MAGNVVLFTGPMFAGKTERLIDIYYTKKAVFVIKPTIDTRCEFDRIVSHSGAWVPAVAAAKLLPVPLPAHTKVVCIDEGQFFPDLVEGVVNIARLGVDVYVAALNGTSDQKPWPQISDLFPYVTEVVYIPAAVCSRCNSKPAHFTKRLAQSKDVILIGGAGDYMPVCRNCLHS